MTRKKSSPHLFIRYRYLFDRAKVYSEYDRLPEPDEATISCSEMQESRGVSGARGGGGAYGVHGCAELLRRRRATR
jgi:hypothetical protein